LARLLLDPLEAPVAPAGVAAAFGPRREASICGERSGRGGAFAVLAKGHVESGGNDGASAW
jgi:hypothetical protein